ncbi:hypothetical protein [Mucilaginibacter straminoryzae]|uniref:hypothetical protein n=1 Tax=Mucilaginibacter straminoryzae TaxID=2932774 RepID=UPI001FD64133|nr:hypothetical protein [Mucilaginibacter straminoryzae]
MKYTAHVLVSQVNYQSQFQSCINASYHTEKSKEFQTEGFRLKLFTVQLIQAFIQLAVCNKDVSVQGSFIPEHYPFPVQYYHFAAAALQSGILG